MKFDFIKTYSENETKPLGFFKDLLMLVSDLFKLQKEFNESMTVNDLTVNGTINLSNVNANVTGDLTGDVKAQNGIVVLDSGTNGTDATFIGDVYKAGGATIVLDTTTTSYTSTPETPILYGRSIDTTSREGVSQATAGSVSAAVAASLNGRFGSVGIQSYTTNNAILMENCWFDRTAFKYISNGSATRFYFLNNRFQLDFAPSGTSGNTAVFTPSIAFSTDGDIYLSKSEAVVTTTIAASDIKSGIISIDVSGGIVTASLPTATSLNTAFPNMNVGECYSFMVYPKDGTLNYVEFVDGIGCTCPSIIGTNGRKVTTPRMVILKKTSASTYSVY